MPKQPLRTPRAAVGVPAPLPRWARLFPWWALPLLAYAVLEYYGLRADGFSTSGDKLRDPDTMMRLAIIRQAQATGGFHHGFFPRDNAPYGFAMHWTLPFNWLVLGLSKLFDLFMPGQGLEQAGYWTGPILTVAIAMATYFTARQITRPAAAACAAAIVMFSPSIAAYGRNGTANHHGLMVLDSLFLALLAFKAARRPEDLLSAVLAGIMAAFCLWTSAEILIVVGPVFLLLFGLWVREGQPRTGQVLLASAAFSIGVSLFLLVDPPFDGLLDPVIDRISMPYMVLADFPLVLAFLAWRLHLDWEGRAALFMLCGLICGGLWLLAFPQAPEGVQGALGPYLTNEWAQQIVELHAVTGWQNVIANLGVGFLSSTLIVFTSRERNEKRAYLAFFAILLALAWMHYRLAFYLCVASAFYLARHIDEHWRLHGAAWRAGLVICAMLVVGLGWTSQLNVARHLGISGRNTPGSSCQAYPVRDLLNDQHWLGVAKPNPIFLDDFNQTPDLLFWTNADTVAGNYHPNRQGLTDTIRFMRATNDAVAKDIARRRGIDFVLFCGGSISTIFGFTSSERGRNAAMGDQLMTSMDPTLYTRMWSNQPPSWLKRRPWPAGVQSDLILYQVVSDGG